MSTFDAQNIESTSGGATDFSQGLNVGGSSITSLITMTEYYSQAGEPSSPANGAVWWDGSVAYQYVGGAWRILSVTPPPTWFGERATFAGGYASGYTIRNEIDYITISSAGNATDFGDLTVARYGPGGASNGPRGVFAGGQASPATIIDYITFATTGNATDFGDLLSGNVTYTVGSCSDGIYGVFASGSSSFNTIEYITIATTGNALDFGDLTVARASASGTSNGTRGVFGGGGNVIDYITIASPGNAVDFGDLTQSRDYTACAGDSTYAVWAGGVTGGTTFYNTMDYVTIATTGNATDFGDMTQALQARGGTSNNSVGVFGGGSNLFGWRAVIDQITIATPANATSFGDLTVARNYIAATSGN